MPSTVPVFFHVGYHKTGSTWLQRELFRSHPQVWLVNNRFKNRAAADLVVNLLRDEDFDASASRWQPLLDNAEPPKKKPVASVVSFEGLSGGLWQEASQGLRGPERIHGLFPEARVALVLREQFSALRSIYAQYVNEGGSLSLRRFLDLSPEGRHLDLARFEYDRLIEAYQARFGADRVLVLPYEQFTQDPAAYLESWCSWLGVAPDAVDLDPSVPHNVSMSPLGQRILRLANRLFRKSGFNPKPLLFEWEKAGDVRHKLQRSLDPKLLRRIPWPSPRVPRSVEEAIRARVAASNARTAELTGLDLAAYGYAVAPGAAAVAEARASA